MRFCLRAAAAIAAQAWLIMLAQAPASAHGIVCHDGAQLVAGSYISTPYCQDLLLAAVAREYGVKASAESIRANPNIKRDVCRFVGRDIRASEACGTFNPFGRRGY
jgi:hypothetical protein